MKHMKSVTAAVMSVLLAGSLAAPVWAGETPSEKEEVIYIMTDASGKVSDMEAVNIFAGGEITDYGDYSAVKSLNTTDKLEQDGDKISFTTDADKVYYQGTMKSTDIPWKISIRYFLDGEEKNPEELAGKSGALEIHFSVSKNDSCKGNFYENYALQAAFTLDTDLCKNIVADQATEANVGSSKQLSYTILPGRGIDAVIQADVMDFEMAAVTINGVRLKLNIDVDDTELTDKVEEMTSAISSIDNAASNISSGAQKLSDATGTLNDKVGELNSGAGSLADGAGNLYNGLAAITAKNDELTSGAYAAFEGLCSAASSLLNSQLQAMGMGQVTLTPSTYSDVLTAILGNMGAEASGSAAAGQISALKEQLDSYAAFYQGLLGYTGAVSNAAAGGKTLKENMDTLSSGTDTLQKSVGELNEATRKLYNGTKELASGTGEFADKTSDMDTQIEDAVSSVTSSIGGEDSPVVSFVSEKNTNVDSVQFVIKTDKIEKPEAVAESDSEEAPMTLWQKLLHLFGAY